MKKIFVSISFKSLAAYGLLAFFTYLMLLITLQYLPIDLKVAFLKTKHEEIRLPFYQIAFFSHVYTSMLALSAGFIQFSNTLRKKYKSLHRTAGKVYVAIVLFISGPTGLIMGYYANGGMIAQVAFCLLAILWIYFTYKAYTSIREHNVIAHWQWMYRSYALTLSAITLRLWKWAIVLLFELRPMDTYRIVAWLGWAINLAVAEWLIYRFVKTNVNIRMHRVSAS